MKTNNVILVKLNKIPANILYTNVCACVCMQCACVWRVCVCETEKERKRGPSAPTLRYWILT